MIHFRKIFFLGLILSIASFAFAADNAPSIKATINKKRIFIGDRIRYRIDSLGSDFEIKFPQFKDNKIGDYEVKDSGNNWLDITSYYVGKRKIPSIEIKYRKKGESGWKTAKTGELDLTVESVLPRGVKLYDIKDIKGLLYPFSILKLIMWILAAFVIIWIFFMIIKMFRKKAPPKLPHETAMEEIEAAKKQLASNGDVKEYYVRISDAIRRYIETVFSLRAPEMTTQEFLMSLNNSPKLSSGYKGSLQVFMEACDLVKFAKHAPSRDEIDSVFDTAKKFIEETKGVYADI